MESKCSRGGGGVSKVRPGGWGGEAPPPAPPPLATWLLIFPIFCYIICICKDKSFDKFVCCIP